MNIKDFDFKRFFLQRGEWVGLGVALAIMLPALYSGTVLTLTSGSATRNAEEVKGLAKAADNRIASSQPPSDADKPPPESELMVRNDRVEPEKYTPENRWFVPSQIEDTKRRAPDVLTLGDFQVAYVRGGMMGHIFTQTADK